MSPDTMAKAIVVVATHRSMPLLWSWVPFVSRYYKQFAPLELKTGQTYGVGGDVTPNRRDSIAPESMVQNHGGHCGPSFHAAPLELGSFCLPLL